MWWHTVTHGRGSEGETGEWSGWPVLILLRNVVYPALLTLKRTRRLPAVDWTDSPAYLNGLVRLGGRQNVVSARVPSGSARDLRSTSSPSQIIHDWLSIVPQNLTLQCCPEVFAVVDTIYKVQTRKRCIIGPNPTGLPSKIHYSMSIIRNVKITLAWGAKLPFYISHKYYLNKERTFFEVIIRYIIQLHIIYRSCPSQLRSSRTCHIVFNHYWKLDGMMFEAPRMA